MHADDAAIDRLLDSVAGARDVDWDEAVARAADTRARTHVEALRDVARVAGFHRALQRETSADSGPRALQRWGDLLLLERVGTGSSADVYRAWDPTLQREVALKLLRAASASAANTVGDAWLEEARALARVRDLHVVTVHGAAEIGGRAGLWMEYLHGPTLEAELARRGALPADRVVTLGAQLASALAAVHEAGALHRDVKPANVILERDGRAVLTDFGLGRRVSGDADVAAFSGTPLFMSPQRLAGSAARASDDVYALGVTLWCALAGKEPFAAEDVAGLRKRLADGPAPSLAEARPDAPAPLVAAIERAMARDPNDRFADANAMQRAFESAAIASAAPAPAARHEPSAVRRPLAAWAIAAGIALAALAVWMTTQRAPRNAAREQGAIAPAPAPAAPSAGVAYDVSATFLARGAGGETRLRSGDRVRPGDAISLEFRATRPAHVYVLDSDEHGETYLLFPQPMFDRMNPLPAGVTVVLPGPRAGKESAWEVTSRGGREHLLVVASPEPLPDLEAELARLPAPVPGRPVSYARVGAQALDRLRGIGGVSDARVTLPAGERGPGEAFERVRTLAEAERGVRGPWVRQVVLENPQ